MFSRSSSFSLLARPSLALSISVSVSSLRLPPLWLRSHLTTPGRAMPAANSHAHEIECCPATHRFSNTSLHRRPIYGDESSSRNRSRNVERLAATKNVATSRCGATHRISNNGRVSLPQRRLAPTPIANRLPVPPNHTRKHDSASRTWANRLINSPDSLATR